MPAVAEHTIPSACNRRLSRSPAPHPVSCAVCKSQATAATRGAAWLVMCQHLYVCFFSRLPREGLWPRLDRTAAPGRASHGVQICNKGMGSAMLTKPKRMEHVVRAAAAVSQRAAITFKTRTGYQDRDRSRCAASILAGCGSWGASAVTLHGRTRNQRYSRQADWKYVAQAAAEMPDNVQLIGNGDVFSWEEYAEHMRSDKVRRARLCRCAWMTTACARKAEERCVPEQPFVHSRLEDVTLSACGIRDTTTQ